MQRSEGVRNKYINMYLTYAYKYIYVLYLHLDAAQSPALLCIG
jgi:hypothetical protein